MPLLEELLKLNWIHLLYLLEAEPLFKTAPVHHMKQSLVAKQIELQAILFLLFSYLVLFQLLGIDFTEILFPIQLELLLVQQISLLDSHFLVVYWRVSFLQKLLIYLPYLPLEALFGVVSSQ